jgi:MraZ protein
MLIGQFETKIGAKRRLAIPGKVRRELGDKLILARFYEGSLVLVNLAGWEKLMNRLTSQNTTITASVRDTDRFVLSGAFEVEPDAQGRIIVPAILAQYAKLSDDVVFLGLGDRVEVWDKASWKKRETEINEYASFLVEKLAKS